MRKMTKPIISVVSTMVEVTAKPNAAASASRTGMPSTRPSTANVNDRVDRRHEHLSPPRRRCERSRVAAGNCSWIACAVTENAPVMTDWLAITVAAVASTSSGQSAQPGASR